MQTFLCIFIVGFEQINVPRVKNEQGSSMGSKVILELVGYLLKSHWVLFRFQEPNLVARLPTIFGSGIE